MRKRKGLGTELLNYGITGDIITIGGFEEG